VIVGQQKQKKALELALQELCAAQAKIQKLTRKRGERWSLETSLEVRT